VDVLRSNLNKALPSVPYPLVSGVLVDSTAWTADFRNHRRRT
jgi:hypothetical protein